MDFLKRLFKSKKKGYDSSQWSSVGGGTSGVDPKALLENNKEWVFIAVDKVSKGVSKIRFKVMKTVKGKDDVEVFTGPLANFLYEPGEKLTGKQFFYLNTAYKELTGNAFWEILDDKSLRALIPTCMTAVIENGQITSYKYSEGTGARIIPVDKVLHDRYVDPKKPYWGVGKLEKIARWVDTNMYANEFSRLFYAQGAQFGGFIETDEESRERIELIKAGLLNEHVGIKNAHKIAVLPKNSKFVGATATMADMQYSENDDRMRDKILSGFGVPKTLVGFTTDVNRASIEGSEYIFASWTIKPIVDEMIDFLNAYVVPLFDKSGQFYFAYEEFVPVNMDLILKERESALNRQQYKTINEVRAEAGLPPIDGGDIIYGSPFGAPIGSPEPTPDEEDATGEEDGNDEDMKGKPAHIVKSRGVEKSFDKIVKILTTNKALNKKTKALEDDTVTHKKFVSRVGEHEKLIANKVRDFDNKQKAEVMQKLGRISKNLKGIKVSMGDIFDLDSEVTVMIDFLSPLLKGLLIEQALAEFNLQDFPGQFDSNSEKIKRIISISASRMGKSYNRTTLTLLKQAINEGVREGESLSQIADRVSAVYEFSAAYRAEVLARTESFYLANKGNIEAYKQSGVVKTIRWYTAPGSCEFCDPLNGEIIDIDENFFDKGATVTGKNGGTMSLDYRAMDVPPLHPNCNCFVRAEEIEVQQL